MSLTESTRLRLKTQLGCLASVLGEAGPEAIDRRPPSGKWSARENLAHLGRHHEVFLERVRRMLAEDRPRFERYRAEEDPAWPPWAARPTGEVLERLKALRADLVRTIEPLSPAQLARTGIHSALGEMALPLWIEFFLLHEAHHLYVVMARVRGGG